MVAEQECSLALPERWNVKAKSEVVLWLLRGEAVDAVSRELQVPAHELEAWRKDFLEGGVIRCSKTQECDGIYDS